jgi:hypothetical protein
MDTRPEPRTSPPPLALAMALDAIIVLESFVVALLFRFDA